MAASNAGNWVTATHISDLIRLLAVSFEPRPAVEIASVLNLRGTKREALRRRAREVVEAARQRGLRVCASSEGYWLSRSDSEWSDYMDAVRRKTIFRFVEMKQVQQAVSERATGQGTFFETNRIGAFA